jgi:alpha-glucosidase (family GH31 glycosyl hydrolase)
MTRLLLFLIIAVTFLTSCKQAPKNYLLEKDTLCIEADGGTYRITALTDDIIKVRFSDSLTYSDRLYAPVLTASVKMDVRQQTNKLIARTSNIEVHVQLNPLSIEFHDIQTGIKLSEEQGFVREVDTTSFRFKLQAEEAIYGTGGRALPLNRRGYKFLCYNKPQYGYGMGEEALNYSLPHILSSEDYMLLFDNPAKAWFDIGETATDVLEFRSIGGNMAYYFINGGSFDSLIDRYTDLTGKQSLVPIWTLGNLQSRFGYRSQQEAEEALDKALDAGYPVDAIILDIYWFGPELEDGRMGDLDWDLERWPEPKKMIERFREKGVKTITVSEPFFTRKSKNYKFLSDNKFMALDSNGNTFDIPYFYFGAGGLLDIFKPEARDWIWDRYLYMKDFGIAGWWVDLGEPEQHPDGMHHHNGMAYEIHGAYGHEWAKMLYEGYQNNFPDERLFHMGRAGFAGSQRYGLIPWTGDVGRSWSGFEAQPSMMLSMGVSGLAYMHSDAGGFSKADRDEELYTRWLQYAVFTPVFRPHADEAIPPEPVFWSRYVQDNVKPLIELRYQMLPYNYTLAWENSMSGKPLARPLFTEFEGVSDTLMNQYMWGDALMIAPVMLKGITKMPVYLPEGSWYDFWTAKQYEGDQWKTFDLQADRIPVFARAGSFLTTTDLVGSTDDYTGENLSITHYFSEGEYESQVYFDDGKTKDAYQKGKYHLLKIQSQASASKLEYDLTLEGGGYESCPDSRNISFTIVGLEKEPQSVVLDKPVVFEWNEVRQILSFKVYINQHQTIKIAL